MPISVGGAGSPSNTMWPGPRPTSVPFTWSFTWCGHTSMNLCSQGVNRTSVHEKPIRVFLKRCRWFLKQLTESTSNVCWSRLFHLLMSLSAKKLHLTSKVCLCLTSFSVCPLRCFVVDNSNIDSRGIADQPLAILNTSMISALFRLSSKLFGQCLPWPNCWMDQDAKWHLDPSSSLATVDIGQRVWGAAVPVFGGGTWVPI